MVGGRHKKADDIRKMMSVSDERVMDATDRISKLREGDDVVTTGANISQLEIPSWLDKEKFYRAREVYRTHFASVNFSHLCGLLMSFYFSKNIETLKSTGLSDSTKNLYHRYIATVRHVQSWYEGDVWNVKDPAHKSLSTVRSMHARVASKMASKNDGIVYVSQWDMGLTQWAFIGPMILFPSQVGLHNCSAEDNEALIHFWRGIGYLLGIQDSYNLCHGSYNEVVAACSDVLHQEYKEKLALADSSSVSMARQVVIAFHKMDSLFTWGCLGTYIHRLVNVPCPVVMGALDWVCYGIMSFMMVFAVQYTLPRLFMNHLLRWRLEKADKTVDTFQKYKKIGKMTASQVTAG